MKKLLKKGYLVYNCLECKKRFLNENHIKETAHYAKVKMEWQGVDLTNRDIEVWRHIKHNI